MADTHIVKVDQGAVNERILAREVKADFRRIEAASVKVMTHFTSAEAKRLFVRCFSTLQLNGHFISVIARSKLRHEDIEKVEAALRDKLEAATLDINRAIDGTEALFKRHGITRFATYDTRPLEIEVGIISSIGRRYFELLNKLDQVMPLVQTLEIHEVITPREADIQRALFKKAVRSVAGSARNLAGGLRRRMNELAIREAEQERAKAARGSAVAAIGKAIASPDEGEGEKSAAAETGDTGSAPESVPAQSTMG